MLRCWMFYTVGCYVVGWNTVGSYVVGWNPVGHHVVGWNTVGCYVVGWNAVRHYVVGWNTGMSCCWMEHWDVILDGTLWDIMLFD